MLTAPPTTTVVPVEPSASALPDSVPDLLRLAPKDAVAVMGLPSFDALASVIGKPTIDVGLEAMVPDLERIGLGKELVWKTLSAFDGAIVFVEKDGESKPAITVIARVKDDSVIEPLVKAAKLESVGPDRWQGRDIHVAWLAKAKVALISSRSRPIEKSLRLVSAERGSFVESPFYKAPTKNGIWLAVDPSLGGVNDTFEPGSVARLELDIDSGAMRLELIQNGPSVPRVAELLTASALDSVGKLPSGPVAAAGISIKRPAGKGLGSWITEAERITGKALSRELEDAAKDIFSLSIAEIDQALGDELTVAAYYDGKREPREDDLRKHGAVIGTIAMRDEKAARRLVDNVSKLMVGRPAKTQSGTLHLERDGLVLDIKTSKDKVSVGFGSPALVSKLATPKATVASSKSFENARKGAAPQLNGLLWLDFPKVMELLPLEGRPAKKLTIDPVLFVYEVKPNDRGSHYVISSSEGLGAVATLGGIAATSIYGVRRYLAASKTSEAKNTVGAIARGAVGAYERESLTSPTHALCRSAQAVPKTVPSGTRYQPSAKAGEDFETGSPLSGWKCLKFTMSNPHYYQYDYRAGGNYKGPKRGLPDPGPNGFEASAEGDLDGDGKTSLFTLIGKVENGSVKLSTELNVVDELE